MKRQIARMLRRLAHRIDPLLTDVQIHDLREHYCGPHAVNNHSITVNNYRAAEANAGRAVAAYLQPGRP